LDARIATLQDQAMAAFINHAEVQETPTQRTLDDLAAFELTLFSSPGVRALANAIHAGVTPLSDPDPPLTALEQQGKAVFLRACAICHGGPGGPTTQPPIIARFHDNQHHLSQTGGHGLTTTLYFRGLPHGSLGESAHV
jgi:cytochrome c peroxidase